ncbi:MAG: Npt1/Npt2 family nucleotide transporter [Bacteroidota bacterium]
MLKRLSRLFSVRPEEWPLVLLLQGQLFLIVFVLLIVKPISVALFIDIFGAKSLANIFIVTAFLAALLSHFFAKYRQSFGPLRLNLSSLGGSFISLLLLLVLNQIPMFKETAVAGLYLWMAIYGLLAASQFWMLANYTLDKSQAKRLFGFIGAGGILGGTLGGYLTSLLSPIIPTDFLLLFAGCLLLPAMVITIRVWKKHLRPEEKAQYISSKQTAKTPQKNRETRDVTALKLVTQSKSLRLICSLILLGVMVSKLVEYQFSALGAKRYPDPDELASFFGFWLSTFSLIAIILQLLVTSWVLRLFSVWGALLFLPLGIGFGALFMLITPGLPAALISRGADGSFKQSLNRAASELLFIPLSSDLKQRVKTYIDVFIDSLASGLAGIILIFLIEYLAITPSQISWVILVLVVIWIVCVVLVREVYADDFRSNSCNIT